MCNFSVTIVMANFDVDVIAKPMTMLVPMAMFMPLPSLMLLTLMSIVWPQLDPVDVLVSPFDVLNPCHPPPFDVGSPFYPFNVVDVRFGANLRALVHPDVLVAVDVGFTCDFA